MPSSPARIDLMRTSYSALETYKNCPLKYKLQEIDRMRVPKSVEAIFGTLVHSALKKMFERSPLFPALDEVVAFFISGWSVQAKELAQVQPDLNQEVLDAYLNEGLSMIKNFYKKNPPWNFNVVELESRFAVPIEDEKNGEAHILAGIIDRIDKSSDDSLYEIIDYKTSKRMPSQEDMDKNLQLSIYYLGILKKWPHLSSDNVKLSFCFLKHNEKIETKRTKKDLEKTKTEILKIINEIQDLVKNNKEFIPTPSALCGWCGYKKPCPMWKHLYGDNKNTNINECQAKEAVDEYFLLKNQTLENNRRISALQAQIRDFMAKTGVYRVFGQTGYLTQVSQEKEVFDVKKAKLILQEIGRLKEVMAERKFSVLRATKNKASKQ